MISKILQAFHRPDSIIKESLLVASAEYFMLGALFIINILVTRYYGLGELGVFNFTYAVAQIAILGIGSSFSLILRRDLTLFPERQVKYVRSILKLRLQLLMAVIIVLLPAVHLFGPKEPNLILFSFFMFLIKGFDLFTETYYTTYQSLQLYKKFSIIKSLNALCSVLIVFVCCIFKMPIVSIYLSMLGVAALFFFLNKIYYQQTYNLSAYHQLINTNDFKEFKRYLLKESWPLMANAMFFQISSRISVVIIFVMLGKDDAGLFSTGLIIVTVFSAAASALGIVLFPKINKMFTEQRMSFIGFFAKLSGRVFILGIVVYAVFLLVVPFLKDIFGNMPEKSNVLYMIMGASIPFIFLAGAVGNIFTIIHKQKTGMFVASVILVLNIGILYFFILFLKARGFALAFTIGNALQILLICMAAFMQIKKMNQKVV